MLINSGYFKKGHIPFSKLHPELLPRGDKHWHFGKIKYPPKLCKCGCGQFTKTRRADVEYVAGHHPNSIKAHTGISWLSGKKLPFKLRKPREVRFCACGCGQSWECTAKTAKRYLYQHWSKTELNRHNKTVRNKMSNSAKKAGTGTWKRTAEQIRQMISAPCERPNKFEAKALEYINKIYNNKFIYTGDGSFIVNNRSADAYSEELKIVALFNGCYWHLTKKGYERTDENKRIVEEHEAKPFIDGGYKIIFIWEDELAKLMEESKCLL